MDDRKGVEAEQISAREDDAATLRARMRTATRVLSGARALSIRENLDAMVAAVQEGDVGGAVYGLDGPTDVYGDGIVEALEHRVAELLGTEDAAYFPSGTMAQQVALRCWAQETGCAVVATHPLTHLEMHERHALRDLTGLRGVWPSAEPRNPTGAEIRACAERFGTLVLELPMRDAGFVLPDWDSLSEAVAAARERGSRVHFDGARLWEAAEYYGRPLTQIAGLADSVYVSFYKSLGGVSGAAVGAPAQFVKAMKAWRHRYGGQIFQQWPAVVSALIGIDRELPRLPRYVAHAKTVAAALAQAAEHTPGVSVFPEPPHTHQFRLYVPFTAETLRRASIEQIEETGIGLVAGWRPAHVPGFAFTEVTAGAAALDWTAQEVTAAFSDLLGRCVA
jgi:threonine aldolase